MALRVTVAPTSEPLTVAEAKAHLRVTNSDDDTYIGALIVTAREAVELKTGRSLMPQTLLLTLDRFPDASRQRAWSEDSLRIILRRPPISAVSWVKYYDASNVLTTLSPSAYVSDFENEPGRIRPAHGYCWPDTYDTINAVSVQYVVGYANAAAVPQSIKNWMLLRIGALFENREEVLTDSRDAAVKMPFMDGLLDRFWVPEIS